VYRIQESEVSEALKRIKWDKAMSPGDIFFLERAGKMCIIVLRSEKRVQNGPIQKKGTSWWPKTKIKKTIQSLGQTSNNYRPGMGQVKRARFLALASPQRSFSSSTFRSVALS
jgi:hypothetical protein